jgi:hypothetical protein
VTLDEYPAGSTEAEKVEAWRLQTLIEAGCPITIAEQLATASNVDLHRTLDLLANGCSPELAAEILL